MATITIHAAKTNLSKLIERAEAGEEVVIARNGKPAVRLMPVVPDAKMSKEDILESFRQLNAKVKDNSPEGWSYVDEFLAEKHLEGFWENGNVSDEERRSWLGRLERYEIWPRDIEDFLAERTSRA